MLSVEEHEAIAQAVVDLVKTRLPGRFGVDPLRDIQVLCPMNRSVTGVRDQAGEVPVTREIRAAVFAFCCPLFCDSLSSQKKR
jgi:hypothetical protein